MHHHPRLLARCTSATVALLLALSVVLTGPVPRALATGPETPLFRAAFDAAPLGPLTGPLVVETGTVVPQEGTVTIAAATSGQALQLESAAGQATALMQWSNYPGPLPADSQGTLTVRITGDFTTSISNTTSAALSLLTGTSTFELFSFGPDSALTRGGSPLGLSYAVSSTVSLDARLILKKAAGSTAQILLKTASGMTAVSVPLPNTFSAATLNQIQFQAPASSGTATADRLLVTLTKGENHLEPPPMIVIKDSDIEQEIEHVNGLLFVSIKITILNTGGRSDGTYLVLNLDDFNEEFDLDDISFLIGVGFVSELNAHQVVIGLGQNNLILSGEKIKVKIKFKAKKNRLDIKIKARFNLAFGSGDYNIPFTPVIGTTPISGTTPITGTTPISGTTLVIINRLPLSAIDVRFVGFWRSRGGLDIFGLPISQPITLPSGAIVQYFERARLEYSPQRAGTRYAVLLGLLGAELGYIQPTTATTAPTSTAELSWYFPASGHLIAKPFRAFWQSRGGLLIFGMPIGEAHIEEGRLVQYFERARFEYFPENAGTRYEVQLGLLGVRVLQANGAD